MEVEKKGRRLFGIYPSLAAALKAAYPDYPWDDSKFLSKRTLPQGYWKDKIHLTEGLNRAAQKLGIEKVKTLMSKNTFTISV
jgi:hypothetical protein